jgi:hypothetical protein
LDLKSWNELRFVGSLHFTDVVCGPLRGIWRTTFVPLPFELGRRHVTDVFVEALGVVPVDSGECHELDVFDRPPRSLAGSSDQLGLVLAIGCLGQRVVERVAHRSD